MTKLYGAVFEGLAVMSFSHLFILNVMIVPDKNNVYIYIYIYNISPYKAPAGHFLEIISTPLARKLDIVMKTLVMRYFGRVGLLGHSFWLYKH